MDRSNLLSDIPDYLVNDSDELLARLQGFIETATQRLNRALNVVQMERVRPVVTQSGPFIAIPDDHLAVRSISVRKVGAARWEQLERATRTEARALYPDDSYKALPRLYCVEDKGRIRLVPAPLDPVEVEFADKARVPAVTEAAPENVFTRDFYDLYLAACLVEASLYTIDDKRGGNIERWKAELLERGKEVAGVDLRALRDDVQAMPAPMENK